MRIYVIPVEYKTLSQMFHLMEYFFQFDTGIHFRFDAVMWLIFALFLWISLWDVTSIHRYMDLIVS